MSQYPQDKQQYHQQEQQPQYQQYDQSYPQQPAMAHTYQAPTGMSPEKAHDDIHAQKQGNQSSGYKWSFGLFDCFSPIQTCLLGWCCPCYLFGKTYERNKTGEKDPSGFNGMCAGYCVTLYCGCAPILQCVTRQTQREKNGVDGSMVEDFLTACCCGCCALIQEEKDSIVRVTGVDPKTGAIYQPVPNMTYP